MVAELDVIRIPEVVKERRIEHHRKISIYSFIEPQISLLEGLEKAGF